ncbi:glycosyltransferase family 4 protein [Polyangium mundeleinium]|uniref:Glycosyltransferase family 4 protein n=1 Tax=Polyangium mundeleinium TaxID=2995306 RepID=A0ABT5EZD2_9BACT|nr:glycosyltransferase family 4 protein [Polyangium mundeleinium]MDC0747188.1 glycosyltransferase family 4 protein [Polyangium mundeleinium]
MRILFVAPNITLPGTNGGSTHVTEVVRALRRRHEVQVLAKVGSHGEGVAGVGLGHGGPARYVIPFLHFPAAYPIARRFRPDAIYERFSAQGLGIFLGRALGVPVVSMILDTKATLFTLEGADRLISTAPHLVAQRYHPKLVEVSWGANIETFHPGVSGAAIRRRLGIADDEIVAGYTGAFYHWHGLDILVAAAAELDRDPSAPKIRYLLVGDGEMRRDIEARIQAAGLSHRFLLTGRVPYEEVPAHIAASDFCVAAYDPDRHEELRHHGMFMDPLKVFEYLAVGKAAITFESPNMRRLFKDGEHALLVPPGQAAPLTAAIRRAATDAALRERLGQAGRALVERKHSWQAHGEQLGALFEEVVEERRRRG